MPRPARLIAQLMLYGLFAAVIGILSNAPSHTHFPPDKALIKLSFSHPAKRKGECRRLTRKEIAKLAPNMRRAQDCPRSSGTTGRSSSASGTARANGCRFSWSWISMAHCCIASRCRPPDFGATARRRSIAAFRLPRAGTGWLSGCAIRPARPGTITSARRT